MEFRKELPVKTDFLSDKMPKKVKRKKKRNKKDEEKKKKSEGVGKQHEFRNYDIRDYDGCGESDEEWDGD